VSSSRFVTLHQLTPRTHHLHSFAGQLVRLLHPGGELRFVEFVLVDVEVAHILVFGPVMLPPGRAMLATNPASTGSISRSIPAIGIMRVAFLAAAKAQVPRANSSAACAVSNPSVPPEQLFGRESQRAASRTSSNTSAATAAATDRPHVPRRQRV
jgi:hypothetical protein